jgi:O-antigen/teichoic acid export membrane protein
MWPSIVATTITKMYNLLVGLAILFITARILGPEGQGIVAAATTWAAVAAVIAGMSLGQVTQHRIQVHNRRNWLPGALGALLATLVGAGTIAYIIGIGNYVLTTGKGFGGLPLPALLMVSALVPILIWEEYASHLLTAAGQLHTYNKLQVLGRTLWLIFVILLVVLFGLGPNGAIGAQVLGLGYVFVVSIHVLRSISGGSLAIDRHELLQTLRVSLRLHPNTIGSFLIAQTSVLVLNHVAGSKEVGWYHLAWQMVIVLSVVGQAVGLVLYARMAELGPNGIWPEQKKLIKQAMLVVFGLMTIGYFSAPYLVEVLAGPSFSPSVPIFRMLLPILVGSSLAQMMAPQWIGRGELAATSIVTVITGFVSVAANLYLIPRYGIYGAVWSNLFCYALVVLLCQLAFVWWCEAQYRKAIVVPESTRTP